MPQSRAGQFRKFYLSVSGGSAADYRLWGMLRNRSRVGRLLDIHLSAAAAALQLSRAAVKLQSLGKA